MSILEEGLKLQMQMARRGLTRPKLIKAAWEAVEFRYAMKKLQSQASESLASLKSLDEGIVRIAEETKSNE